MAALILLNGPSASGKSTLARRFVDANPLALNLDIDIVRGLLGRWLDAEALVARLHSFSPIGEMHDMFVQLLSQRPLMLLIPVVPGDVDRTFAAFLDALDT